MIWSKWTAFDKTWVATGEVVDYRRRAQTLQRRRRLGRRAGQPHRRRRPRARRRRQASPPTCSPCSAWRRCSAGRSPPPRTCRTARTSSCSATGSGRAATAAIRAIVGRTIQIDGEPYEVIGVMPPDFRLPTDFQNPEPSQLWLPHQLDPPAWTTAAMACIAAGRLKPGATVAQAADELHGIAAAMTREGLYPAAMQFDTVALSLDGRSRRRVRRASGCSSARSGSCCSSPARTSRTCCWRAPKRGSARLRCVRRSAPADGAWCASCSPRAWCSPASPPSPGSRSPSRGVRFLGVVESREHPARRRRSRVDLRVAAVHAPVALLTSVALQPRAGAARASRRPHRLAEGRRQSASSGGGRQRFRNALVVVEMALAVVLLVGAGLMLRSLWALQRVRLGLRSLERADHAGVAAAGELPDPRAGRRLLRPPARTRPALPGVHGRRRRPRSLPLGSRSATSA